MKTEEEQNLGMQTTLADKIELVGTGLHSGLKTTVTVYPAEADSGIVFISDGQKIKARASNVIDTSRGTTLGNGMVKVKTVEHLLATLSGMGIDNALVEINGPETPALDGSAKAYVDAISSCGLKYLDERKKKIKIIEPVCVKANGSFVLAVPSDKTKITYVLNYDHPLIGSQICSFEFSKDSFAEDIASARTFVLYEEVAGLLSNGLSKGGSIENVIVVWQDKLSSDLRFDDEFARHKMLDLIGDISLAGGFIEAEILAVKSGHTLNIEFAKEVEKLIH
ncbi:MAG: UDP-3-O-acyl-N-acetylglucosamine deacetylase [Armatimonadota bacterium]